MLEHKVSSLFLGCGHLSSRRLVHQIRPFSSVSHVSHLRFSSHRGSVVDPGSRGSCIDFCRLLQTLKEHDFEEETNLIDKLLCR